LLNPKKSTNTIERSFVKTLTDVGRGIYVPRWAISSNEIGTGDRWCIEKCRIHGGTSDSVDIITVDNGKLSFVVVPTRGMGIWKGDYQGLFLGWQSPVKNLVHPHYVDLEARGGLGWLQAFNEWVVRCGLSNIGDPGVDTVIDNTGKEKEVMLTLHGRIANIPASIVKARIGLDPPHELGVEGVVYEQSMFGPNLELTTSITTTSRSNSLRISDVVGNLRSVPDEMQLLYHCNFGSPFLEEGTRFLAPVQRIAPYWTTKVTENFDVFGPPESGFIEQAYFMRLLGDDEGYTKAMLVNGDGTKAVSLSFSVKELPCFTLWKNTVSIEDGYVAGLEPATSFPNPRRSERERKRVTNLRPGERYHAGVTLSIHLGKDEVQKVRGETEKIRGEVEPVVIKEPVLGF